MKRAIIFLILGIFLLIIARYNFEYTSPFSTEMISQLILEKNINTGDWDSLNTEIASLVESNQIYKYLGFSAIFGLMLFLFSVFFIFAATHLIIDKLFFKDFYQRASLFDALRRALEFIVIIFLSITLNLLGYGFEIIIFSTLLIFLVEVVFATYIKKSLKLGVYKVKTIAKEIDSKI